MREGWCWEREVVLREGGDVARALRERVRRRRGENILMVVYNNIRNFV